MTQITMAEYEAGIPKCCEMQTLREHQEILLCWGLVVALEEGRPMICGECEMATRTDCCHEWQDDGDNLQAVCQRCGERRDVDLSMTPEEADEFVAHSSTDGLSGNGSEVGAGETALEAKTPYKLRGRIAWNRKCTNACRGRTGWCLLPLREMPWKGKRKFDQTERQRGAYFWRKWISRNG